MPDTHPETIWSPERIRALRAALHESRAVFGDRFGVSRRTVENWERGQNRPSRLACREMARIDAAPRRRTR